ncbi:MAG: hypothetical protein IKI93_18655, partial [Clostridia bacterium]|nr:hypothetical protein [Clostridia bacterium]
NLLAPEPPKAEPLTAPLKETPAEIETPVRKTPLFAPPKSETASILENIFAPRSRNADSVMETVRAKSFINSENTEKTAKPELTEKPSVSSEAKPAPAPEVKCEAPIDKKKIEQTHIEETLVKKQEETFRLIGTLFKTYILIESDNGERTDHDFEKSEGVYAIFRSSLNNDRITGIRIETEGNMTGVRMSSVLAYEHTYEVLKNPTVHVGETSVLFECELMSSDFIEFDGKNAKVIDRYGNEKPVWFTGDLKAPRGKLEAVLTAKALNRNTPRARLTLGFTGKEIR